MSDTDQPLTLAPLTVTATLLYEVPLPALPSSDARDPAPILEFRDRALYNSGLDIDGAADLIEGFSHIMGNATAYHFLKTDHRSGTTAPLADVLPPANFKIDSAAWTLSGPNLIVGMTVHEISAAPDRRVWYARAVVPNVVTPRSDGRGLLIDPALLGGPPAPNPSPEPTDPAAIAEAVLAVLTSDVSFHTMLQRYAKNGAREALAAEVQNENGALQFANAATFLRTPDGLLTVLKDGLYLWMQERVYETIAKFLPPKA